jgi:hypothetical protein
LRVQQYRLFSFVGDAIMQGVAHQDVVVEAGLPLNRLIWRN